MKFRRQIIFSFISLAVLGVSVPEATMTASAEDLFSGQSLRLNDQALNGVQEAAPAGPAGESYDYVRSTMLNIESDPLLMATVGQTFSVKLMVSPGDVAVNVAKASLSYPSDVLKLVAIDGEASPFSMVFDEQAGPGEVAVTAMRPAPGISDKAQVAELYFVATAAGEARIDFQPDSVVLANDGHGSDVLASAQGLVFGVSEY